MQLSVIPMKKEHIGFVYSILNSEYNKSVLHTEDISFDEWERNFLKNLADSDEINFIIMANEPVAWLKLKGLQEKQAWLSMLVVREDCQHQGIGSFAVRFAENYAKSKGFSSLGVYTDAENIIIRRLCEKLGYILTEKSECADNSGKKRTACTYLCNFTKTDITFILPDGVFNVRVGAVILRDNKVLLVNNGIHYYSVGGRIKLHETFEQAVVREVFEELNITLEVDRLLWTHENFFTLKGGNSEYAEKRFHEISFFYLMKPSESLTDKVGKVGDNDTEWLEWVPIDELHLHLIYPIFFQTELRNLPASAQHIVTHE